MRKSHRESDGSANFAQMARSAARFALSTACAVFAAAVLLSAQTPSGSADNGKKVYPRIGCDTCHGASGEGTDQAPAISPPGGFASFVSQVRTPSDLMPDYPKEVLSDAEVADIYAFLQTPAGPAANARGGAAPAESGNADNGKKLYPGNRCDLCHGASGEGAAQGPQVAPPGDFAGFLSQLRTPVNKMPVYPEDKLSDAQAADIYAFLKSLGAPPASK